MHPFLLPLTKLLRLTPDPVIAKIVARAFNHMLRGQGLVSRLAELDDKSITLRIIDVPCALHFRFWNGRLLACRVHQCDVTISGRLTAFLRLAGRREDPDTLFFKRELNIEGETETGVHIKNLLDSLEYDWDAHFDAVLCPPLARGVKRILRKARHHAPKGLRRHFTTPHS
ncbi:MAG: SCP2 domain-containing protein [Gammaproteobacteria bacterium]